MKASWFSTSWQGCKDVSCVVCGIYFLLSTVLALHNYWIRHPHPENQKSGFGEKARKGPQWARCKTLWHHSIELRHNNISLLEFFSRNYFRVFVINIVNSLPPLRSSQAEDASVAIWLYIYCIWRYKICILLSTLCNEKELTGLISLLEPFRLLSSLLLSSQLGSRQACAFSDFQIKIIQINSKRRSPNKRGLGGESPFPKVLAVYLKRYDILFL